MHKYLLVFALTSWCANAQSASTFFYSYSAWDRLTDVARTAYVSGVMDSMIIFAVILVFAALLGGWAFLIHAMTRETADENSDRSENRSTGAN
jgi:hypothetical protein